MSSQSGLSDHARYERFAAQWREPVLREAGKWCGEEQSKQLLADAVLSEFRKKYADADPPANLEYYLRAQVCLVYSMTGQSTRKLEQYIDEHGYHTAPEEAAAPRPAPEPEPVKAPEPVKPPEPVKAPEPVKPPEPVKAPEPVKPPEPVKAPEPVKPPEPVQLVPAAPEKPPQKAPAPAKEQKAAAPDTFLDPVRTTFWTPDDDARSHVVQEIELPDEEEDERSVGLSFLNTVLFLLTAASFCFCVYETGFLQYLLQ